MGKGRILVVEDDFDISNMLRIYFTGQGYDVQVAPRGGDALMLTRRQLPQLIVLDIMLPDMNGLDLVHYLRRDESGFNAPLVVVSGQTGGFLMSEVLKAGADVFLGKPIGVSELIGAFTTILPQMTA